MACETLLCAISKLLLEQSIRGNTFYFDKFFNLGNVGSAKKKAGR